MDPYAIGPLFANMMIVWTKDTKDMIKLNKRAFKHMRSARSKELMVISNAGHLFGEESGTIERVEDIATPWFVIEL